jgi:ion channel
MASVEEREARFRFGGVFLLVLTLLVFVIVAPSADWSRALACAIQWLALLTVVATSRAGANVRRPVAIAIAAVAAFTVAGEAAGGLSDAVLFAIGGLLSAAIPLALVGGLMRLVRARGVTPQAVAGALTFYLLLGLWFAWVIGFVARVGDSHYFAQQVGVSTSQVVYYSFTVMTTTGFGDLTAATHVGRALAVVEMLLGQLYLVTVIGVLVGNFAGRARRGEATGAPGPAPPLP